MSHDDIDHHVRIYMRVFAALLVLTVVTVAVSYIELTTGPAIALGLFIASIKASLVACYFMHMISEKKLILWVMALSMAFFSFELLIPMITDSNSLDVTPKTVVHETATHGEAETHHAAETEEH